MTLMEALRAVQDMAERHSERTNSVTIREHQLIALNIVQAFIENHPVEIQTLKEEEMKPRLKIGRNGDIAFVHDDRLTSAVKGLGTTTIERASHVEPEGDEWTADMAPSGGPVLGPFLTRGSALTAEREWLRENKNL